MFSPNWTYKTDRKILVPMPMSFGYKEATGVNEFY